MSLIIQAARIAAEAHKDQARKWTGRAYIEHPGRVAARITRHPRATEARIAAAWLHDVLEDCPNHCLVTSPRVFALVKELTNPSKQFPELSREERKAMDREHLRGASEGARLIKLADRADNLNELRGAPADFVNMYCRESQALLVALTGTDEQLEAELLSAIKTAASEARP